MINRSESELIARERYNQAAQKCRSAGEADAAKAGNATRRLGEAARIRLSLNAMRGEARDKVKGGPGTVAFVKAELCIGCDQCTIVCDDDAIELYDTPLASPILNIEVNKKAKILRDPCTGCRLCVLACPTDAIIMIDR